MHQWYLREELICLEFYDEEVAIDVKQKMVKALEKKTTICLKRAIIKPININGQLSLDYFITKKITKQFFRILGIPSISLSVDVNICKEAVKR